MILLAKTKLNRIEVLISKALIDLNISHDELVLINNVRKEFYDTKEEIKILITNKSLKYIHKTMLSYCLNCRKTLKVKIQKF